MYSPLLPYTLVRGQYGVSGDWGKRLTSGQTSVCGERKHDRERADNDDDREEEPSNEEEESDANVRLKDELEEHLEEHKSCDEEEKLLLGSSRLVSYISAMDSGLRIYHFPV